MKSDFISKIQELNIDAQELFVDTLVQSELLLEDLLEDHFKFRIHLTTPDLETTVSSDFAKTLCEIQSTFSKMCSELLYGSALAVLTKEEKANFRLSFEFQQGSGELTCDLFEALFNVAQKLMCDRPLEAQLFLAALLDSAFLGVKHAQYDDEETDCAEENDESEETDKKSQSEFNDKLKSYLQTAYRYGETIRTILIKNTPNLTEAEIGYIAYTRKEIENIKNRRNLNPAQSDSVIKTVCVDQIDATDKNRLRLTLREKDTDLRFVAVLVPDSLYEADLTDTLDIVWNSARYANRYFSAEIAMILRNGVPVDATVLSVSQDRQ